MTSESPDTQRELPDVLPTRIGGPVLFSVVLHGAVLLLFARSVFSLSTENGPDEERPSIRVALAVRPPPPLESEPPVPEGEENLPSEPTEVPEAEPAETVVDAAPAEPSTLREEESPALRADETLETSAETGATIQPWTSARIRAAVQTYGGELRSTLTGEWTEECILERRARSTRDCEQLSTPQQYLSPNAAAGRAAGAGGFAGVTRRDRNWVDEERLKEENELLGELIGAGGELGALASHRYYMNRESIFYLTGNRGDLVFGPMQNFSADVLSGPQLSLLGNIPFRCRAKKPRYGLAEGGVGFGNVVPCIQELSDFNIERPEQDPNEFRVVPIALGNQR